MDQCEHCEARGFMEVCEATDCPYHEMWYVKELNRVIYKLEKEVKRLKRKLDNINQLCYNILSQ